MFPLLRLWALWCHQPVIVLPDLQRELVLKRQLKVMVMVVVVAAAVGVGED